MKQKASEWLKMPKYKGIKVLDPDGWDRKNYDISWNEPMDQIEFERRLSLSTCFYPNRTDVS